MSKSLCFGEGAEEGEPRILTSRPQLSHPLLQTPTGTPGPLSQERVPLKPSSGAPPRSILKSQMIQGEDALAWSHFEATSSAALRTPVLVSVHI